MDINTLLNFLNLSRKENDFDLFFSRYEMTQRLLDYPTNKMQSIHIETWYKEFWRLVGSSHISTKFSEYEEGFCQQLLNISIHESNLVRQQYLAMALLIFGKYLQSNNIMNQNLWCSQMREDYITFVKYNNLMGIDVIPRVNEIINNHQRTQQFLRGKYADLISEYSKINFKEKDYIKIPEKNFPIFFCWFQGLERMPPVVQCCYKSLLINTQGSNYKVHFIDNNNFLNYVDFPSYLIDKYRTGKITKTHFSDILRFNLLEKHGGLWFDSTILITQPLQKYSQWWSLPYFTRKVCRDKNLFHPFIMRTSHSPATFVTFARWAGFFQCTSIKRNPLFTFGKTFFEEYWKNFDELIEYFLIDLVIDIAYDNIPFVKQEIDAVPINNTELGSLVYHLNDLYKDYPFDHLYEDTFLYKLTYRDKLDMQNSDTVFREIQKRCEN